MFKRRSNESDSLVIDDGARFRIFAALLVFFVVGGVLPYIVPDLPTPQFLYIFPNGMLAFGVDLGAAMGTLLIVEGWLSKRGELASGFLFLAGFIMLAEAGYMVYLVTKLKVHG